LFLFEAEDQRLGDIPKIVNEIFHRLNK